MMEQRAILHAQKKQLEEKIKKLDEEIKPMLSGRGPLVHAGWMHEVKPVSGRTTYDYKAMVEDGIDLEPYKKVGAPSTRYELKQVQEA